MELRRLESGDAGWVADLLTEWRPDEPTDPEVLLYEWTHRWSGWFRERFAVLDAGRPVGYAACHHPGWEREPERFGRFLVRLPARHSGLGGELLRFLERRLAEEGARRLRTECYEDERWLREELERRGYRGVRVERAWELDLDRHRERLLALTEQARARVAGLVRLVTLAEAGEVWGPLTQLFNETEQDIPHSLPVHPDSEEEVREQMQAPHLRPERVWLAVAGGRPVGVPAKPQVSWGVPVGVPAKPQVSWGVPVGVPAKPEVSAGVPVAASYLAYPPLRGNVWTDYTCCARSHRGLGIARAVKMETIAQAIELGVRRIRTQNDASNAAILHINETLGYEPISGVVEYVREVA